MLATSIVRKLDSLGFVHAGSSRVTGTPYTQIDHHLLSATGGVRIHAYYLEVGGMVVQDLMWIKNHETGELAYPMTLRNMMQILNGWIVALPSIEVPTTN